MRKVFGFAVALVAMSLARPSVADPIDGAQPAVYGEGGALAKPDETSGAMTYAYPFRLPAARGKIQPSLALQYNSSARDGDGGYGWSFGLPTIEYRPLSGFPCFDASGNPVKAGNVVSAAEERYYFDGQPLVQICPDVAACTVQPSGGIVEMQPDWALAGHWAYFRLQRDTTFARFYRSQDRTEWRVQLKGGERLELGATHPDQTTQPLLPPECDATERDQVGGVGVIRYRLSYRRDASHPSASLVAYCWKKLGTRGLSFLTDIWDTPRPDSLTALGNFAHHTQVDWEEHDFASASYANVDKAAPDLRARRVAVASATWLASGARSVVRSYDVTYFPPRSTAETYDSRSMAPLWHHSFIKQITERAGCGSEDAGQVPPSALCNSSMPPVSFQYEGGAVATYASLSSMTDLPNAEPALPWVDAVTIVDLDRNGLPDVVQGWESGPCSCNKDGNWIIGGMQISDTGDLYCQTTADFGCNQRSARPLKGYLNTWDGSVGSPFSFKYQCMGIMPANIEADIVEQELGWVPAFLTPRNGTTMLGAWSDSHMLWELASKNRAFTPYFLRPIDQTLAPGTDPPPATFGSGGCEQQTLFDASTFYPRWRVEPASANDWIKPAQVATLPGEPPPWFVDVDGDGLVDKLGSGTGEDVSNDLRKTVVEYSRMYSRHEEIPNAPGTNGPALVPFIHEDDPPQVAETLVPKPAPRGMHFYYADVNGDGLVDLVTHFSDNNAIPRVYPGNGRGRFACDAAKQSSWPCLTGVTTDPALQPYELTFSTVSAPFEDEVFFHDVTGDGLADMIVFEAGWNTGNVRLWINRDGHTLDCAASNELCMVGDVQGAPIGAHRVAFADMDANGTDDIVVIANDGVRVGKFFDPIGTSYTRGTKPGQLITIDNGVGATTEVQYASVQELDVAAASGSNPDLAPWSFHSPVPAAVVTQVHTLDTKATLGSAEAAPYAIDRKVRYYYRDPAYDRWKRALVGFRKVAVQEGDVVAVTETTRWFSECENANEHPVVNTVSGSPGNYTNSYTDGALPLCPQASDDNEPTAGTYDLWLSGRVVSVARYAPKWLGGPDLGADKWEWFRSFDYAEKEIFAPSNERGVWRVLVTAEHTYFYDTASSVSIPAPLPHNNGDGIAAPPTQGARRHLMKTFTYGGAEQGNLTAVVDAGEVTDTNGTIDAQARTEYFAEDGSSEQTCDADWRCNPRRVVVSKENDDFEPARRRHFIYDTAEEVIGVEGELTTAGSLDRSALGTISAPHQAGAGVKTLAQITRDSVTGMPTRIAGPGSATSSQPTCTSIWYDDAYGQFPSQVTRHAFGCDQASGSLTRSFLFDRGLEVVTSTVAENLGTTTFQYDDFGRLTDTYLPRPDYPGFQSYAAHVIYGDQAPLSYVDVRIYTNAVGADEHRSVEILNGIGEPVLAFDPDDDGTWVVSGWTIRGTDGQAYTAKRPWGGDTSDPIAVATNATQLVNAPPNDDFAWIHDPFGRLYEVYDNGTRVARRTYLPLSVTSQDAEQTKPGGAFEGGYTQVDFDGHGRVHQTTTVTSDGIMSTQVDRSIVGEPKTIRRCDGICSLTGTVVYERSVTWDTLGRIIDNDEPNTSGNGHHWKYVYDDANRLVGTSDARGCGVNYYYDGFGRTIGEDYSPCIPLPAQPTYSAPDLGTMSGFEVVYRYDNYEDGQVQPDDSFDDNDQLSAGRLVSIKDRGSHTRFSYDVLGRVRRSDRRIAKPASFTPMQGDEYGAQWFSKRINYDLVGRKTWETTGVPDIAPFFVDGASDEWYSYSAAGHLAFIGSAYGNLIDWITHDPDGLPHQIYYSDAAQTTTTLTYDSRRRLQHYDIARGSIPPFWSQSYPGYSQPGGETTQTDLALVDLTLDDVGNPQAIVDQAPGALWPRGAKPKAVQEVTYDGFYRARLLRTTHATSDGSPDVQESPFDYEVRTGDTHPAPLSDQPLRVVSQSWDYDALGNVSSSSDDAAAYYDRSLGNVVEGTTTDGPNQLRSAQGINARYDDAGNLVELKVERPGTCSTAAGSMCAQWYAYDWDETGALVRARRWDYPSTLPAVQEPDVPSDAPAWDLRYAYSAGGRVLKSAKDSAGIERHTLDVFGTFRVQQGEFNESVEDYVVDTEDSHLYLADGMAHVIVDRAGAMPLSPWASVPPIHVFMNIGDHLGSTSFVIDKDSGELAERASYQGFGAIDSDYRPDRWTNWREPAKFTGKEEDIEVGLHYFGARYYHARLGRWASADPLTVHGLGGDLNPYAYVGGRVTASVDPFGLDDAPTNPNPPSGCGPDTMCMPDDGPITPSTPTGPPNRGAPDVEGTINETQGPSTPGVYQPNDGYRIDPVNTWKRTANGVADAVDTAIRYNPQTGPVKAAVDAAVSAVGLPQAPPARFDIKDAPGDLGRYTVPAALIIFESAILGPGAAREVAIRGSFWRALLADQRGAIRIGIGDAAEEGGQAIRMVDPRTLRPTHGGLTRNVIDKLARSMRASGYDAAQPIEAFEIEGNLYIRDGHHRAAAAVAAKIQQVPVMVTRPASETMASEIVRDFIRTLSDSGF